MSDAAAVARGRTIRLGVVLAAGAAALAGAAGLTSAAVFTAPGTLKYALTVGGPLLVLLRAAAAEPLLVLGAACVLAVPFADLEAQFAGVAVSPIAPLVALAVATAIATGRSGGPRSLLWRAALVVPVLLAAPLAEADGVLHHAGWLVLIVATAWVVASTCRLPGGDLVVMWSFVATASLQATIALWEWVTDHRLDLYGTIGGAVVSPNDFFGFGEAIHRPAATLPDPISLGNLLAAACPLALGLAVRHRALRWRLLAIAAVAVIGAGSLVTLSRMSWIAAVAGLLVAALALPRGQRAPALAGLAVAACVVVVAVASGPTDSFAARASSILDPTSTAQSTAEGDRQRQRLWAAARATGADHPIAGVGLGQLRAELERQVPGAGAGAHAHSTYLQAWAEAGVLGLLAILVVVGAAGGDLWRALRRRRAAAGAAGALVAVLVSWTTDHTVRNFSIAAVLAIVLGLAAGLGRDDAPAPAEVAR